MNLKGFFKECHEKEVFKMLSIYVVSSWVILQVLALIAEPLNFPEKSLTYLILILIIGFPIHVYFIWKLRLKKMESDQTGDDSLKIYKSPFHRMYFSGLLIISSISAFSAAIIINKNLINDFNLERDNSNDKIAVLKFENFTGDENLIALGDIAANWIVHGITENSVAQVISPKVVNDYTSIIKSQAGSLTDVKSLLKTYFKPSKVITGGFYKENGKLLLQASIMDGLIDRTFISFETIECDQDSPLDCIEVLKQKVLGYLMISENKDDSGYLKLDDKKVAYFEETPPKYQAYQYNLSALELIDNDSLHLNYINKAIKADPNYFEPKIHLISYYFNNYEFHKADSMINRIDMNSRLSRRQKNYIFYLESLLKGKNDKAYRALKQEYEKAYLDIYTNQSLMTLGLQLVNRPQDIDEIYKELPMGDMNIENCSRCMFRYYLKGLADVELKKYDQVKQELLPVINIIEDGFLKKPVIMAYARSGANQELGNLFRSWELSMDEEDLLELYLFAGNEYLLIKENEFANGFFNKIISNSIFANDTVEIANAYYYSKDYRKAQLLLEKINASDPKNSDVLVKLAISNYKNGDHAQAEQDIKNLDGLRTDYQYGEIDYGFAQYYASIEDSENTLSYLRKAVAAGKWFTPSSFQNDPHFLNFRDNEEFIKILNYWNQLLGIENTLVQ